MLGRVVHKADFERLLATRSQMRSTHFAVHHVSGVPSAAQGRKISAIPADLSTSAVTQLTQPVDDSCSARWIGCVVPKRHARRAVTRSLLKRQIRASFERHAVRLSAGLWLVRLRAGFAATEFISARSAALTQAARAELDSLLSRVA